VGRIIHVEITAADVWRATDFYAEVFGWKTENSPFVDGYVLADTGTGDGIDGAIMTRGYQEQPTVVWVQVDDIDTTVQAVRRAGGSTVNEKNTIPGVGHVIYVRDTEGTVLGLRQPLPGSDQSGNKP
jgi:uncharacterized protein